MLIPAAPYGNTRKYTHQCRSVKTSKIDPAHGRLSQLPKL